MVRLDDKARCESRNVVDYSRFSVMHIACDGLIFTVSWLDTALIVNGCHASFFFLKTFTYGYIYKITHIQHMERGISYHSTYHTDILFLY